MSLWQRWSRKNSESQNDKNVVVNVTANVVTNEEKVLALLRQDGKLSANQLSMSIKTNAYR